jgi:hypothetical protein
MTESAAVLRVARVSSLAALRLGSIDGANRRIRASILLRGTSSLSVRGLRRVTCNPTQRWDVQGQA